MAGESRKENQMAGYSDFSMSNNAVAAYQDGLRPASKCGSIPAALVERFVDSREWHHSSKMYNAVNFFDPREVAAVFGLEQSEEFDANPAAIAALAECRATAKDAPTVFHGCIVRWLEWSGGTARHPKAAMMTAAGCTVAVKGATATITVPAGPGQFARTFQKRLSTRGFVFKAAGGRMIGGRWHESGRDQTRD